MDTCSRNIVIFPLEHSPKATGAFRNSADTQPKTCVGLHAYMHFSIQLLSFVVGVESSISFRYDRQTVADRCHSNVDRMTFLRYAHTRQLHRKYRNRSRHTAHRVGRTSPRQNKACPPRKVFHNSSCLTPSRPRGCRVQMFRRLQYWLRTIVLKLAIRNHFFHISLRWLHQTFGS